MHDRRKFTIDPLKAIGVALLESVILVYLVCQMKPNGDDVTSWLEKTANNSKTVQDTKATIDHYSETVVALSESAIFVYLVRHLVAERR